MRIRIQFRIQGFDGQKINTNLKMEKNFDQ